MARTSSGQLGASLLETLIASALAGFLALLLIKFYQLSVGMRQQPSERLTLRWRPPGSQERDWRQLERHDLPLPAP